jgi:succinyldiaminopimelate transaminase
MVALLPALLGIGEGDIVVHPTCAYPSYDVGARLAGARPLPCDDLDSLSAADAAKVRLVWINSPANPDGRVLGVDELAGMVHWARERGVVVASDECYAELAWEEPWASQGVPSLLDPRVTGGDMEGLLALYSLSKQSNLAGYRAAWIAGDRALVRKLLEVRKHAGFMMPGPVQNVMVALLGDHAHVEEQKERYRRRRTQLRAALEQAGYRVERSQAGLYLWITSEDRQPGWQTVADLAGLGILVAPGLFYGEAGLSHARVGLTASDKKIAEASARLLGM